MDHAEITHELPPDVRLLPGEELQNVITHESRPKPSRLSSLEQILRLTRAAKIEEIGKFGPSVAALAFTDNHDTPDHLKLYEVIFGRDSLRVAIDLLSSYPELARVTTIELAKLQGTEFNTQREEEPGRIVHEARDKDDPIARQLTEELGWGWPYYGSVDATPEFIRTLSGYCRVVDTDDEFLATVFTDKDGELRSMADALIAAVNWIIRRLDSNPEGLLEYKSLLPRGLENQVWKDSWDAYHHSDGKLASHHQGIASIEVQVTTYDALLDAAELYETVLDRHEEAKTLRDRAETLKQTIFELFWTEEKGGYFVLGTDRDPDGSPHPLKIRTSNMGHTLNSRLLEGDDPEIMRKREAIMTQMMSPEMLNISGIRTLASDEYRFRAGAYHNGSVWLWDTHHIAKGMRRLKYHKQADDLDRRVLKVVDATHSFPEYVRGDDAKIPHINRYTINIWDSNSKRISKLEQPPQEVQAWTVAAILAIKKRMERRGLFPKNQSQD
jgi:glycogen debranching enzyme